MGERIPGLIDYLTQPQTAQLSDFAGRVNLIGQPKLDGVRAVWLPGKQKLFTKNGREITSAPHIVNALQRARDINQLALDGELYLPGASLTDIAAAVRQVKPASLILQFHVFDYMSSADQEKRCRILDIIEHDSVPFVCRVPWVKITRAKDIRQLYQHYLDQGYEGLILRQASLWYADGKQHAVLKIKPLQDNEFTFLGFAGDHSIQLKGTRRFTVAVPDHAIGQLAAAGTGARVTIAYNRLRAGVPEFPRFKAVRQAVSSGKP